MIFIFIYIFIDYYLIVINRTYNIFICYNIYPSMYSNFINVMCIYLNIFKYEKDYIL